MRPVLTRGIFSGIGRLGGCLETESQLRVPAAISESPHRVEYTHHVGPPMRYVNYLEDDASDPAAIAYGANLPRLREIKGKYDPENFFRQNVNVRPS
jgi:Berberine and berberine like